VSSPSDWLPKLGTALKAQDGWFDAPTLAQEAGIDDYDDWCRVQAWLRAVSGLGLLQMSPGVDGQPVTFRWAA